MAVLNLTAGSVVPSVNAVIIPGTAGVDIDAGEIVYQDTADKDNKQFGKMKLCDGNGASAAIRAPKGMAANSAAAGQPLNIIVSDPDLEVGAHGLDLGEPLFLSDTPGKMFEYGDIATGNYTAHLAQVKSATKLSFAINAPGVLHAAVV